jgi:hypothetical protein
MIAATFALAAGWMVWGVLASRHAKRHQHDWMIS